MYLLLGCFVLLLVFEFEFFLVWLIFDYVFSCSLMDVWICYLVAYATLLDIIRLGWRLLLFGGECLRFVRFDVLMLNLFPIVLCGLMIVCYDCGF